MGVCHQTHTVRKEYCCGYECAERSWTEGRGSRTLTGKNTEINRYVKRDSETKQFMGVKTLQKHTQREINSNVPTLLRRHPSTSQTFSAS